MKLQRAAVGVLCDGDGRVLLQQRGRGRVCEGYWEFPGGKMEESEAPPAAARRELAEELGVDALDLSPWLVRKHSYPHAEVELYIFRTWRWRGDARGREGQRIGWFDCKQASPAPLLPANEKIWRWLSLPPFCAVTAAELIGVDETLRNLPTLLGGGGCVVQLRDKNLPAAERRRLATEILRHTRGTNSLLLINDDKQLATVLGADGLHLSSRALRAAAARPPFAWVGASCHNAEELSRAAALGCDFAVLSPVMKTLTHVDAAPLEWGGFAGLTQKTPIPVFALGGLAAADAADAARHGAHGIGMMRGAWAANGW